MTRKRVTVSQKKQRHEWALKQIDAGMGLSELTALTAETWGVSRHTACDVVAKAYRDWIQAFNHEDINQRDLLFQCLGRLERTARISFLVAIDSILAKESPHACQLIPANRLTRH